MGKLYPEVDQRLRDFIADQPLFFVATAPGAGPDGEGGHVNVSPKGYHGTFAVLSPRRVAYLDLTGSGAETIAHLRQNARITIMFCSFGDQPKILRLYGTGTVVVPSGPEWDELAAWFPDGDGLRAGRGDQRAIIDVDVHRIADSCGYSVPRMELIEERDLLVRWAENKTPEKLVAYREDKNSVSIDGLPSLDQRSLSPALAARVSDHAVGS
jgi:Pyridoxamine 5'-phosphate oxidase